MYESRIHFQSNRTLLTHKHTNTMKTSRLNAERLLFLLSRFSTFCIHNCMHDLRAHFCVCECVCVLCSFLYSNNRLQFYFHLHIFFNKFVNALEWWCYWSISRSNPLQCFPFIQKTRDQVMRVCVSVYSK